MLYGWFNITMDPLEEPARDEKPETPDTATAHSSD
jgi:hypothetical protein